MTTRNSKSSRFGGRAPENKPEGPQTREPYGDGRSRHEDYDDDDERRATPEDSGRKDFRDEPLS